MQSHVKRRSVIESLLFDGFNFIEVYDGKADFATRSRAEIGLG